jgi:hypothetical protein
MASSAINPAKAAWSRLAMVAAKAISASRTCSAGGEGAWPNANLLGTRIATAKVNEVKERIVRD